MTQEVRVDQKAAKLSLSYILVAFIGFGIAAIAGLLQGLDRAQLITLPTWLNYYQILTAHGVLMGLVFTTFFIEGFLFSGIARVQNGKLTPLGLKLGWVGFWVMLIGTVMGVITVLMNDASVLFTFYAPMKASPFFYIGAALIVVGSWIGGWGMFAEYRNWKRNNPGKFSPLFLFTAVATMTLWQICTLGVAAEVLFQLIPWSLGMVDTVNVLLSRTLLWFFGHPLVYFWLMPAYMTWYLIMPKIIGGKVFSDSITRLVFVIFVLLSTPIGFHHQLMEPGIDPKWKFLHVALTLSIAIPSLITAFTMFATFELAGRAKGATGLFGWFRKLPWKDARFFSLFLAMLWFIPAGAGGIINASNQLNQVVHNTIWVTGHFHLTIGTAVALTFFCVSYWLIPHLTGRKMTRTTNELGRLQAVLWSIGMIFMSGSMHTLGLLGGPRRTAGTTYMNDPTALSWIPFHKLAALGGAFLFFAAMLQVGLVLYLAFKAPKGEQEYPMGDVAEDAAETPRILERWPVWISVAVILILVAYGYPIADMIQNPPPGAPGVRTW
ncbi:b(o/a)3-type cytochrome-c oxidase subunit 1 [Effusibacillus lacus]|uniref:Cytochrome c n=1 Tax=Effusibacillus lacus TaxID=1348429 RepID=A0A292YGL0_9BACL|nr:b(o/a)3-type cytochrome-c oxidase subunit 1 [Effusibacillus lacus]TCS74637.1 cytochrome c oxidase subunit 1 [Effusibacillus lacus]GAX88508.1 cytochrome c [Effusibacillus lacus]